MSRCGFVRKWITAYASGDLRGRRAAIVTWHLEACPGCRREFERELSLLRLFSSLNTVVAPRGRDGLSWEAIIRSHTTDEGGTKGIFARLTAFTTRLWGLRRAAAEAGYWGWRVAVPAAGAALLLIILAHAGSVPRSGVPAIHPRGERIVVRVNFGPPGSRPPHGFLQDIGRTGPSGDTGIRCRWVTNPKSARRGGTKVG